jgi:hypothetical protein
VLARLTREAADVLLDPNHCPWPQHGLEALHSGIEALCLF